MKHSLTLPRMQIETNAVAVDLAEGPVHLPLQALPAKYVEWLESGRTGLYDRLLGREGPVRFFAQHLPVLVTQSAGKIFPFNCCHKGVGLIPKAEYLAEFTELFRATLTRTENRRRRDSLAQRIQAVSKFYFDREKIEYRAMTTLEIFQRQTLQNLRRLPLASLLFSGEGPDYVSFQLNCAVEILDPADPRHTFIRLARNLFERDYFHLRQKHFPHAYVFWISEVVDKTPFKVAKPAERGATPASEGPLPWDPEAWPAVQRAPAMIRAHMCEQVENND